MATTNTATPRQAGESVRGLRLIRPPGGEDPAPAAAPPPAVSPPVVGTAPPGDDRGARRYPAPGQVPLLIGVRELAALLGLGKDGRSIYTLRGLGKIPAPHKLGRRTLWKRAEIEAWVDAGMPDRAAWEALRATGPGRKSR